MITKLDNGNKEIAIEIRTIFQASYAIEAKLLKAIDFPPLKRTLDQFLASDNSFHGYLISEQLVAVIELKDQEGATHIQSLVVHPNYFRQGIARELVQFVLESNENNFFTVETGLANKPAIQLYKGFDFTETKQWDTDHGVRKIAFKLNIK